MEAAAQTPKPGDVVAGKYLLESLLGRGGMGAVFRARHTLTDRKVALKWMLPDREAGDAAVQRFLREARAMGRIDHPAVVGVIDVGVEGDAAYLVMELLRGSSLRERLEAAGKLAPAEAIGILLPAMEGLAAAHAAGVVHRDIKPDNLFCVAGARGERPVTKVLDFGVSKLHGDRFAGPGAPGSGAITHTGAMVGTPAYMAPEQVRGERDLDARTDVWALGAILYEALSGQLPFAHETLGQTIVAIATTAPPRLESLVPGIPVALADVVHRALEKEMGARWPHVESFARALLPFVGREATFSAPRPTSVRPPAMPSAETAGSSDGHAPTLASPAALSRGTSTSTGEIAPTGAAAISAADAAPHSAKTSGASATPFVSSSASRLVLPQRGLPWGWIAAAGVLIGVAIGGVVMMNGATGAATGPASGADARTTAAAPDDAGVDAAVVVSAVPATTVPATTVPATTVPATTVPATAVPATPRVTREHTHRASATPAPTSTTTAAPTGGRTGSLSRDEF